MFIRSAVRGDEEAILQLIRDLATYEKEPESVKATPELITKNLFETPFAHALLAFESNEPIGLALYFFNYSTWTGRPGLFLEDLFVSEQHRGKGIAKAFFRELGRIAQEKNCGRMDWSVLKWNTPSIDFYEKRLKAKKMDEWMGMRLEEDGIDELTKLAV